MADQFDQKTMATTRAWRLLIPLSLPRIEPSARADYRDKAVRGR
jgi:hypothetical protein